MIYDLFNWVLHADLAQWTVVLFAVILLWLAVRGLSRLGDKVHDLRHGRTNRHQSPR